MKNLAVLDRLAASIQTKRRALPYGEGASEQEIADYNAACLMAIDRMTRSDDFYNRTARSKLARCGMGSNELMLSLSGLISSLKLDAQEGFFLTFEERVNQDLMSDFLERASRLLMLSQVPSAAALVAGVVELHLRRLAVRNDIATEAGDPERASRRPLRELNNDLRGVAYTPSVYLSVSRFIAVHDAVFRGRVEQVGRDSLVKVVADLSTFIAEYPA